MIQNYRTTNRHTEEDTYSQVVIVDPPKKSWALSRSFIKLGQKLAQVTQHWSNLEMRFHTLGNEYAEIGLNGLKGTRDILTSPQCCHVFGEKKLKPATPVVTRSRSFSSKSSTEDYSKRKVRDFKAVDIEMSREGVILCNKFATYNDVVRVGPWKNDVRHVEDAHNLSLDSVPQSYRRGQRRHPHMGITGLLYWSQKNQRRLSDGDLEKSAPRLGVSSLPHSPACLTTSHRNGITSSPGRMSKSLPKSTHFGSKGSLDDGEDDDDNVDTGAVDADDEEEYEQFKAKHRHLFELPSTNSMPVKKTTRRTLVPPPSRSISVVAPVTPPTSPQKKSRSLPTKRGRRASRATSTIVRYTDTGYDVTNDRTSKDNTLKWFITSMRRLVSRQ